MYGRTIFSRSRIRARTPMRVRPSRSRPDTHMRITGVFYLFYLYGPGARHVPSAPAKHPTLTPWQPRASTTTRDRRSDVTSDDAKRGETRRIRKIDETWILFLPCVHILLHRISSFLPNFQTIYLERLQCTYVHCIVSSICRFDTRYQLSHIAIRSRSIGIFLSSCFKILMIKIYLKRDNCDFCRIFTEPQRCLFFFFFFFF